VCTGCNGSAPRGRIHELLTGALQFNQLWLSQCHVPDKVFFSDSSIHIFCFQLTK
jgi:hypothetical protein